MSDKVDVYMPIFIGDYLKDTTFLTTEQHGAYMLLLFACWQKGRIPNKDAVIRSVTGLSGAAWAESRETILEYFKVKDGFIFHSRINREKDAAKAKKNKLSARGKAGAEAKWKKEKDAKLMLKQCSSNAQAMLKQCPSPSPSPSPVSTKLPTTKKKAAGKLVISEETFKKNPEYNLLVENDKMHPITIEQYVGLKRCYPRIDHKRTVSACVAFAVGKDSIDKPFGLLKKFFSDAPEKQKMRDITEIRKGIIEC